MADEVGKIQIPVDVTGAPEAASALGRVSAAYDKNTDSLRRTSAEASKLRTGLAAAGGQYGAIRGQALGYSKSLDAASASLTTMGMKGVRGGGLVVAGLGLAVRAGMGFDKQMSVVRAATGASADDFGKLRKAAIDWGNRSQFSATEVASSMTELGKAGYDTNQTLSALPGVLAAASASGEDMASVTSILVDTLTPFKMGAEAAQHVTDGLAYAANATTGSIGDMGEAMKYVAPIALKAGQNFDQTNAALIVLAKSGIKGSMAGTSLRGVLLSMEAPNNRVQKSMDKVGLSFRDSTGKMLPLSTNIDRLKKKLDGMSKTDADKFLTRMFGKENISAAQAFLDSGSAGLDKFTAKTRDSEGAAKHFSDVLRDNLSGDLENLGGKIESASIHITDDLSPALRGITGTIGGVVDKFNSMDGASRTAISSLVAIGGVSVLGLGILGVAAGAVASGLAAVVTISGTAAAGLGAVGAMAGTLTFDLAAAGGAMEAFGLLMAANPIMTGALVIGATAAAIYGVSKALGHSGDEARSASDAIKEMKSSLDGLHAAQQGTKDSVLNLASAKNNLADAKEQSAQAKTAKEKRDALLNLEEAYNRVGTAQKAYEDHANAEVDAHNKVGDKIAREALQQYNYGKAVDKAADSLRKFTSDKELLARANQKDDDGSYKYPLLQKELQDLQKNLHDKEAALRQSRARMRKLQNEQNDDLATQVKEANRLYRLTGQVTPQLQGYVRSLKAQGAGALKAAGFTTADVNRILGTAGKVKPNAGWANDLTSMYQHVKSLLSGTIQVKIATAGLGAVQSAVASAKNMIDGITGGGGGSAPKATPAARHNQSKPVGALDDAAGIGHLMSKSGGMHTYALRGRAGSRTPVRRAPAAKPLPPRTATAPSVVGGMRSGDAFAAGSSISNLGSLAGAPTLAGLISGGLSAAQPTAASLTGKVGSELAHAQSLIDRRNALITKLIPGATRDVEVKKRARVAAAAKLAAAQKALKKAKGKGPINKARGAVTTATKAYAAADKALTRAQDALQRLTGERDDGGAELEALAGEIVSDEMALEEATGTRDADGNLTSYGVGLVPGTQSSPLSTPSTGGSSGTGSDASVTNPVAVGMNYSVGVGFGGPTQAGGMTITGLIINAGSYAQGQDAAQGFFNAMGGSRNGVTFASNQSGVR